MTGILKKRVIRSPLDRADGSLGVKRLAILVVGLLVVGAAIILIGQYLIESHNTWEASVTGVATKGTIVNFTRDEESGDVDVASYPSGMEIKEGDRVLIRTDEEEGNVVVKVLDE
jgi:predicted permease